MDSSIISKSGLAVLFVVLLTSTMGLSQDTSTRADNRQQYQRARLADGVRDGEVTRREATALRSEQRHIRRSERRVESDGTVTLREKRRLERKQDRASRHIRRVKNNKVDNN